MKVRLAESAGFCYGVRKAMDCVLRVSRGDKTTLTLGPLIHNPQAIEMLEERNVFPVGKIDESLRGKTVVIRAHGVPPSLLKRLEEVGAVVVDATCPNVLRSQSIIRKYHDDGYSIVIVGDRGHAEIEALLGYSGDSGVVVETVGEARALPKMEKVCVVAQTTLNPERYSEISEEVAHRAEVSYVAKTVCASTERRQEDVRELAETTDATVVVGGRNSANTKRLAEISRDLGQPTWLIEDPSELDLDELSKYSVIGVTAGASTPSWVIRHAVEVISDYTPSKRSRIMSIIRNIAYFAVDGNIVLCGGAAALTYAMCLLMGIPPRPQFILMAFFYLFSLHAVNKYLEIDRKHRAMNRTLRKFWQVLLGIAAVFSLITLGISLASDDVTFALVLVSYLLGGLYSIPIVPRQWDTRFKSFRDIPGSKDIMIATAWTFAAVVLPVITDAVFPGPTMIAGAAFVFTIIFSRATILAMGGIESDKLVGLETIPVLIGRKSTLAILYTINALLTVILGALALIYRSPKPIVLLIPVFCMLVVIRPLSRKGFYFRLYHQLVLDANLYLAGALAFLFLR
jgi:(E)-4-hydroxy-3-methyl-but-2-enyl pyrophosphate reductase